jgi:thermostable 8-oxoguanine DNA glycosylase
MVRAESIDELVRLHAKAQQKIDKMIEENRELPSVIFMDFRSYHVASSDGKKFYSVQFGVDTRDKNNIQFWAACNCYGSLHKEVCYHSALALTEHLKEVERREQAKVKPNIHDADNAPYLKNSTDAKPTMVGKIRI